MSNDSSNEKVQPVKQGKVSTFFITVIFAAIIYAVPPLLASLALVGLVIILGSLGIEGLPQLFESGDAIAQFAYMVIAEALVLVAVYYSLKLTKENWGTIGLKKPQIDVIKNVTLGLLSYYSLVLITLMLVTALLPIDLDQNQEIGFDTSTSGLKLVAVFVSLVILPPLIEETVFRGLLFTRFRRAFSFLWSAIFVSILFSIAHLQLESGNPPLWTAAIDTFVLSMVLVYIREKTGNIWAGVGIHSIKNFVAFYILFLS
jgi:membrane protease YdiL (CAAX protease family)